MNLRPSGYEPDELPNCSTPRYLRNQDCFITIQYFMEFVKHYSSFGKMLLLLSFYLQMLFKPVRMAYTKKRTRKREAQYGLYYF